MTKTIIRVKNNDYPYYTEKEIVEKDGFLNFSTINKKGIERKVMIAKTEISTMETIEAEEKVAEEEEETEE